MLRKVVKIFFYSVYLLITVLVLSEFFFRIYNPFHFSVKGNVIILESNTRRKIINDSIPGIERVIVISRNGLGFRGPDLPTHFEDFIRILTVGGSTTECKYISDNKTWTDLLAQKLSQKNNKIWMNNAGLSGHTTFGHQILLSDHLVKIRPNIVLFLFGANDLALRDTSIWDRNSLKSQTNSWKDFLIKKTETGNIVINLWRSRKARVNNLTDRYYDLRKAKVDTIRYSIEYCQRELAMLRAYLPNFESRVNRLIDTCQSHQIIPVLMTQPVMAGEGQDSASGADLSLIPVSSRANGKLYWEMIEMYNDITRAVAARRKILVIDLAAKLEKGGKYFYDMLHFNLKGNEEVAEIIFPSLDSLMTIHFRGFQK